MADRDELLKIFDVVDDDKRSFAVDALDEYLYFKDQIAKLRRLPLIRYKENHPEIQEVTPAGKLIKDYSQVIDAKRGTILRILNRVDSSAADELLQKLSEFE